MHPPGRASALAGCRSRLTVGTGIVIGVLRGRPAAKQPGRRRSQHLPLHAAGDRARRQPARRLEPQTAARLPMFPARVSWCAASRPTPRNHGRAGHHGDHHAVLVSKQRPPRLPRKRRSVGVSLAGGDAERLQQGAIAGAALSPDGNTLALWITTSSEGRRTAGCGCVTDHVAPEDHEKAFVDSPALSPNLLAWSPDGKRLAYSGFAPIPQCGSCQSRMTARARQCAPSPSTRGVPRRSSRGCRTTNPWSCRRG